MFLLHPIKVLRNILERFEQRLNTLQKELWRLEYMQEALGRIETRQLSSSEGQRLEDNEFRVFSQWGEDGIIQHLLRHVKIDRKIFVEFGVEDYRESNTRFLLVNNNWTGLILDGDSTNVRNIKTSRIYWAYNIKAQQAFVTAENINEVLSENGITGEIGLLSIDIDGNDFWVWRAITVVNPVIVVVEYNHRFGSQAAVTIPYDANFERTRAAEPLVYFGASLPALCWLAERKGYAFVGCNSNGVNAFFVRKDKLPSAIRELTPGEGYVAGKFTETLSADGTPNKVNLEEERQMVMRFPLVNVEELD
ncbi:MAG TPA: hypothetical protein VFH01_07880 [Pyrinomonadaceae bacterium]|nr:hypothetical protein [Pyrinomonadaceae bacterium]